MLGRMRQEDLSEFRGSLDCKVPVSKNIKKTLWLFKFVILALQMLRQKPMVEASLGLCRETLSKLKYSQSENDLILTLQKVYFWK